MACNPRQKPRQAVVMFGTIYKKTGRVIEWKKGGSIICG